MTAPAAAPQPAFPPPAAPPRPAPPHPASPPAAAQPAPPPAPAPLNLRALLEEMVARGASDLHLTAGERAKLRVDGDLVNAAPEQVLAPRDTRALAQRGR